MRVVYAREPYPDVVERMIFLAGPTPRDRHVASWRPQALQWLRQSPIGSSSKTVIVVPEEPQGGMQGEFGYGDQVDWETRGLERCDVIVFWVPRKAPDMPAFTTNDEWGRWKRSGKCVWGNPSDAEKCSYQRFFARKLGVDVCDTMEETLQKAIDMVGEGVLRKGPVETLFPSHVFLTSTFQRWMHRMQDGGNRIVDAGVRDAHFVGKNAFLWSVWASVEIGSEGGRVKNNELVIGRWDVSCSVVWYREEDEQNKHLHWMDRTKVVLVKEFRTAGAGHVIELPGGSAVEEAITKTISARQLALEEMHEELGWKGDEHRLCEVGERAVCATLCAHACRAYALRATREEMAHFEQLEREGASFGVEQDTEKTYVLVRTVRQIMTESLVDWANVGIILKATME